MLPTSPPEAARHLPGLLELMNHPASPFRPGVTADLRYYRQLQLSFDGKPTTLRTPHYDASPVPRFVLHAVVVNDEDAPGSELCINTAWICAVAAIFTHRPVAPAGEPASPYLLVVGYHAESVADMTSACGFDSDLFTVRRTPGPPLARRGSFLLLALHGRCGCCRPGASGTTPLWTM